MSANVLVQTAFLGDLLLSIPLMKRMKSLWPEHKLVLVCRRGVGSFFREIGLVDQVLEIKKGDAASYRQALQEIKKYKVEKVFAPHESLRTALFVRQINAKQKITFKKSWNWIFYGTRVNKDLSLPDAIRQLALLTPFDAGLAKNIEDYAQHGKPYAVSERGALAPVPAWASMGLPEFYAAQKLRAQTLLNKFGITSANAPRTVAFFPGSVWATKRWTEEGFVETGKSLIAERVQVLVMGGPGEEELCARITAQIPGAKDICGQTSILESALVLSQIAAAVGNDSASMHLAATAETPSVVVFGPTVIEFGFRPWQNKVYLVDRKGLACRPCGKHGHQQCPIGTHECMKSIGKDPVLNKLEDILK